MEIQTVNAVSPRAVKRRSDGLKVILVAGLSVQVWGVVMGLGLIILNLTH